MPFCGNTPCRVLERVRSRNYGLGKSCRHLRKEKENGWGFFWIWALPFTEVRAADEHKAHHRRRYHFTFVPVSRRGVVLPSQHVAFLTEVDAMFIWHVHTSDDEDCIIVIKDPQGGKFLCQCAYTCMTNRFHSIAANPACNMDSQILSGGWVS